jgi:tRNA (guanine-N7-)-methyltransferase
LPTVLEIGSYTGETLIEFAKNNGDIGFLGVDIVFKRVVKTAEKIEKLGIKNARVIIGDGQRVIESLKGNALDGICVFFPDPWIKKEKKRLLNEGFFKVVKSVLKGKGFLWVKTDNENYFKRIKSNADKFGFVITNKFPDILKEKVYPTYFESLFENQNKKTFDNFFIKPNL